MALCLNCTDSEDTNICVRAIQWGRLWYDFPVDNLKPFWRTRCPSQSSGTTTKGLLYSSPSSRLFVTAGRNLVKQIVLCS